MLTQSQIEDVWKRQLAAETRALYFADLANRYTAQKKWITAISVFLSSGAVITLLGKSPAWVPVTLSIVTAVINAYSSAFGLDSRMRSMAKLYAQNSQLANDYERLWNNVYAEDAGATWDVLVHRDTEVSETATTEAPNDQKRMGRWQDYVFTQHGLPVA
jgi:hypothetical protein